MHPVVQERRRGDESLAKRQPSVVRRHGAGDQRLDPSRAKSCDEAFGEYFVEEAAAAERDRVQAARRSGRRGPFNQGGDECAVKQCRAGRRLDTIGKPAE